MASTYQTVSYGSTGQSVRQLQNALNKKGYQLDVDGVFGDKTRAAVRDYQKKNKLQLDGVVGQETWSHLMQSITPPQKATTGKQVLSGVSDETADALRKLEKGYKPSDDVNAAMAVWKSMDALRPDDYASPVEKELAALYQDMEDRPAFRYDPTEDEEYARFAALYARQGRRAMEDTLGQAAALTGGYDSSYAQSAGQQAYGEYLRELSELLPQFRKAAREQYDDRTQVLLEQAELLQQQDAAAYGRWQDALSAWQDDQSRAYEAYDDLRRQDYDDYETMLGHYLSRAKAEQAASGDKLSNTGKKAASAKAASLSSTAGESLQRAMENYLSDGNSTAALALAGQYKARMTPAQKKTFQKLFKKYGVTVKL